MSKSAKPQKQDEAAQKEYKFRSIIFDERPGRKPYNASEVIALGDARFLFCDNNIGDALFELRLTPECGMACPLVKLPLRGVDPNAVDDLEGMVFVENGSQRFVFATPSLSLKQRRRIYKKKSERGKAAPARAALLRISVVGEEQLDAEVMPDFRSWLIANAPELGKATHYLPDDGGLNVEGLEWDAREQALLFGLRTPVVNGQPCILRVRLKEIGGPWDTSNLELLPSVGLAVEAANDEQGIRAIGYDPSRGVWLIVIGNSTSSSHAPFKLYAWDGNAQGVVHRFKNLQFHKRMRVEGATYGTIGGRGAIVFVDDMGGYQTIWADDPRLTI